MEISISQRKSASKALQKPQKSMEISKSQRKSASKDLQKPQNLNSNLKLLKEIYIQRPSKPKISMEIYNSQRKSASKDLQKAKEINGNLHFPRDICIQSPSKTKKNQWKSPFPKGHLHPKPFKNKKNQWKSPIPKGPKGNLHPKTFKLQKKSLLPLEICIQRSKKSVSQRVKITIYNNKKITKKTIPPKKKTLFWGPLLISAGKKCHYSRGVD